MCLYPMLGIQVGLTEKGKPNYHLIPYSDPDYRKYAADERYIQIPCGVCIECRLKKSRDWATRMMLERQYHDESYFLTLTYDDDKMPLSYVPDMETGEAIEVGTLVVKDVQDFMKRLRRHLEYRNLPQIRFYACGEYGSQTHRPHYHLIVFGLHLDDIKEFKRSKLGFPYYISDTIAKLWPYGYHLICNVTWDTCAYVARYVTKKLGGDYKEFYDIFNIQPEFSVMSRKPGIAKQYFDEHKDDIYKMDELFLKLHDGGKKVKPPQYYDRLYDVEHHDRLEAIKEDRRRTAEMIQQLKDRNTTLSPEEQNIMRERLMKKRLEMLVRPDI